DYNGDGKLDLAVAHTGGLNKVAIYLGTGTGGFSAPADFATGLVPNTVAVGDFNVDGKPDLAVANGNSNNISILLNNSATCNTQASLSIAGQVKAANNNPLSGVTVTLSGPISRVV